MKKFIAMIIMIACLSISMIPARAYEVLQCDYWRSGSDTVGRWFSVPKVYRIKYGEDANFKFLESFTHARTQWTGAGRSSEWVVSESGADIKCYGGTVLEIYENTGKSVDPNLAGLTTYWSAFECNLDYQGATKKLRRMSGANVYILNRGYGAGGNGLSKYKNTFTHELGHAFGWIGHSSVNSDVMYTYNSTHITLSDPEKNHLCQIFY